MTSANRLTVLGCAALVATTTVAGCASASKLAGGGGNGKDQITMGTANVTNVLDPAGSYDAGAWLVLQNAFQSLLKFPAGATVPQPDAAQSCGFSGSDAMTYHCTLRSGLKFANGHPLTSEDVVFSVQRMQKINDPGGPATLLSNVKSVEAKGDSEVVFHLGVPDAVMPAKLASVAGAIVDHQVFPAGKLLENSKVVGSGPYKFDSVESASDGKSISKIALSANPNYQGDDKLLNNKFTVKYFAKAEDLKSALDKGDVDLTDDSMPPAASAQVKDDALNDKTDFKVAESSTAESRYLVFNTADQTGGNQAVRQAVAQLIDRSALAREVYAQTVEPLYSMVPAGVTGHNTAFYDAYHEPDVNKAKKILSKAGVQTPVKLTLTSAGKGTTSPSTSETVKKQLDASGLFDVTLANEPDWTKYQAGWQAGSYQSYLVSWVPDYPDAEDFITPLVVGGGTFHNNYDNKRISEQLGPDALKQTDRAAGGKYGEIQKILADEVPMVPLVQSKAFYVSHKDITGVDTTVDTTGVFRFWMIGRTTK